MSGSVTAGCCSYAPMALLEQRAATLHDILLMFSEKEFRINVARSCSNETVRSFLLYEYERFSFGYRADGTAPIQNKVGAFLADPLLSRILTAPKRDLHIRRIMDQGQVLLVNLAEGHIGEDSSSLSWRAARRHPWACRI